MAPDAATIPRQRQSAACGPSPGGASERCGRSWSTSAPESRASSSGAGCWAGRCACLSCWSCRSPTRSGRALCRASSTRGTFNTSRRRLRSVNENCCGDACATLRGSRSARFLRQRRVLRFGFFPKISTPVENTVEKRGHGECAENAIFAISGAKSRSPCFWLVASRVESGLTRFVEAKVGFLGFSGFPPWTPASGTKSSPASKQRLTGTASTPGSSQRHFVADGGSSITVRVPNPLFKDWLTKHYSVVLSEALAEVRRPGASLVFVAEGAACRARPESRRRTRRRARCAGRDDIAVTHRRL